MNKNFDHNKNIILTRDCADMAAGSVGKITAWLPDEDGDNCISVMWYHVYCKTETFSEQVKKAGSRWWTTHKPFIDGLEWLNDYTEAVDNDDEYRDLILRMGWKWNEE